MSEYSNDTAEMSPIDELTLLKERARTLGIPLSGNIGVDKLRERIRLKLEGSSDVADEADEAPKAKKSKAQIEQEIRDELYARCMALVRCRVYNLNPSKRDMHGDIITVANRYLGTVRKFIPFGEETDGGYHIPQVLVDELKARQFQSIQTVQKNGKIEVKTRMVPEYNIEILPPLTEAELHELAISQAAAERLGS